MLNKALCTFLLILPFLISQAQININGSVADVLDKAPLSGATIVVEGTTNAAVSDALGMFRLDNVADDAFLLIDFLGYKSLRIAVDGQRGIDVSMEQDVAMIEEVVITALGLERSSRQLGYSLEQLEGREITEVKSVNLVQNLAGKVAGVTITQGATGIGSSSKITIRGRGIFYQQQPAVCGGWNAR